MAASRRLHGRRGLKLRFYVSASLDGASPPSRAAWIEIWENCWENIGKTSPPSRAAWIEILRSQAMTQICRSPPSRAAWIEIIRDIRQQGFVLSRRLHGRRGLKSPTSWQKSSRPGRRLHGRRGLKLEILLAVLLTVGSPPSRAAWIEMLNVGKLSMLTDCRRLHGRRGLKYLMVLIMFPFTWSPPSRAAWIEIPVLLLHFCDRQSPPSRAAWIEIGIESRKINLRGVAAFTGGVD